MTAGLKVVSMKIDQLEPHPQNVRQGDVSSIIASLEAHGQYKPIVVQRSTNRILAGNHTWRAARELGWKSLDVVAVDVSDDEALRILLVDNRTNDLASYDEQGLLSLLSDLAESESGLAGTGYEIDDLNDLLAELKEVPAGLTDPDEMPELSRSVTSVRGDVWLCGSHRVMCGDSTLVDDVDRLMADHVADMVWTDPPYGVAYVGKTADALTIENDDLDEGQLEQFLRDSLSNALLASRPGAAWFTAAPAGPLFLPFAKVLRELEVWKQTLVWLKSVLVMGRSDYHYRHEAIFYGWKPGAAHTAPPDRKQDTIWEFDKPARNAEHPTMKPVALIERAITNHTKLGDRILDPFGGSGSTLIAAHQSGRSAFLMELDPKYVDVICRRFQQHTGIIPINEATGNQHDFTVD